MSTRALFGQIIKKPGSSTRPFAAKAFRPPSHQSAAKVAPEQKRNDESREMPSLLPVAGDEVEVLIEDTVSYFHWIDLPNEKRDQRRSKSWASATSSLQ
jgi:hypothetical protein